MHAAALSPQRTLIRAGALRKRTAIALAAATATLGLLAIASPAHAGGCSNFWGCGTAVNATSRGFHVTLAWGQPWAEPWPVRWVAGRSSLGGGTTDVDGIYTGSGCTMTGIIDGRLASYRYPFVWGAGWHKIMTNETAFVLTHSC
jgi:hypothetical protein